GRAVGLVGVGVSLVAGLLRLGVRVRDRLAGLLIGLAADLLGALLGLGEDRAGPLADALELPLDSVGAGLVAPARLQPVREPGEELLHLVLVVAPLGSGERRVPDPVETRLVDSHAFS